MMGGISLTDSSGVEVDALLRQPKHCALLAYIAMPAPGTWHRRDALLGAFWPEFDQSKARTALRSALHTIRKHLPDGAIRSRGDSEVSLDPLLFATDVAAMTEEMHAGRFEAALMRYGGEFLPSLHIADAEDWEKWLGAQRSRLREQGQKAAVHLCEARSATGDLAGAIEAARRAAEIDPDDEVAARRWIALLDRAGDKSQAFAVYERFRDHVSREFGVRPSPETVALVDAIRTRRTAAVEVSPLTPEAEPAAAESHAQNAASPIGVQPERPRGRPPRWPWLILPVLTAGVVVIFAASRGSTARDSESGAGNFTGASPRRTLVVLPMENETNDPSRAYIAAGLAEGIARRLEGMGGMTVRSGARADWPKALREDYGAISRQLGPTILLKTRLKNSGSLLELHVAVIDPQSRGEKAIAPRRFAESEIRNIESEAAAAIAGEIFRTPLPAVPRGRDRATDPESYRLMLEGWHQLMTAQSYPEARRLFELAIQKDATNARAWSGLSSAWAIEATNQNVEFDEAYRRSTVAAQRALALDSLDGTGWANLGLLQALKSRNLKVGEDLIHKAIAYDPGNPEIYVIASHLYRSAWQWGKSRDAIRLARSLDPLNTIHLHREATIELCAGRPDVALRILDGELAADPSSAVALDAKVRTLARLGRYDDAIASWKTHAAITGDTAIAGQLVTARGDTGYWRVKWFKGARDAARARQPMTLLQQSKHLFETGRFEDGYRVLGELVREKNVVLYRLPCIPWLDHVRGTPQFQAIMEQVGSMPMK